MMMIIIVTLDDFDII